MVTETLRDGRIGPFGKFLFTNLGKIARFLPVLLKFEPN